MGTSSGCLQAGAPSTFAPDSEAPSCPAASQASVSLLGTRESPGCGAPRHGEERALRSSAHEPHSWGLPQACLGCCCPFRPVPVWRQSPLVKDSQDLLAPHPWCLESALGPASAPAKASSPQSSGGCWPQPGSFGNGWGHFWLSPGEGLTGLGSRSVL